MAVRRCSRCGAVNPTPTAPAPDGSDAKVCPTCQVTADGPAPTPAGEHLQPAAWTWADPAAAAALRSRQLGAILRAYRGVHALTQEQLATRLGYDKTYMSMIETGRRVVHDVPTRRHIATMLGIPPHLLGVTDPADSDHTVMLAFAESTVRLADLARAGGRAADAVNELWPLVARLEARAAEGHLEADTLAVLARAWTSLGVCLGTVLPEERLPVAVSWTGKGVAAAEHLNNAPALVHALAMHGNELRKNGQLTAALASFDRAAATAEHELDAGPALALLARAAAEAGDTARFTRAIRTCQDLIQRHDQTGPLPDPFTTREIHLRGLLDLGDLPAAVALAQTTPATPAPAPQWEVIEQITAADLQLATGDHAGAGLLAAAADHATHRRLPHQLQRIIRIAARHHDDDLLHHTHTALTQICAHPIRDTRADT